MKYRHLRLCIIFLALTFATLLVSELRTNDILSKSEVVFPAEDIRNYYSVSLKIRKKKFEDFLSSGNQPDIFKHVLPFIQYENDLEIWVGWSGSN
jgi:hypothetical protein